MSMTSYIDELFIGPLKDALDNIDKGKSINDIKEYINDKLFKNYFSDLSEKFIIFTNFRYSETQDFFDDKYDANFEKKSNKFDNMLDEIHDLFYNLYYSADELKSTKMQIKKIINKFNNLRKTKYFIQYFDD